MATPYKFPSPTDRRTEKLEDKYNKLADSFTELKVSVSELRIATDQMVKTAHDRFDKIDKSLAELGQSLGARVGEVEKEQGKARLRWAKLSGALLIVSGLVAGFGGKVLAFLGALI